MSDLTVSVFSLISMASCCFLFGVWLLPVNRHIISFDLRLYNGLFGVLTYVLTSFIWVALAGSLNTESLPFVNLFMVMMISLFSYLIARMTQLSYPHIDHTYFFSLWFSGMFATFLGGQKYAYVLALVVVGLVFFGCFYIVRRFHLVSSIRTLIVTVDSFESIEYVKRLLSLLNATVISSEISKKGRYQFTCTYRLAALGQHVFMRYVLKSDLLDNIVINDST